jgi:hypothetical protein
LLLTGDVDRLLALERPVIAAGADEGIRVMALGLGGRRDEARDALLKMRHAPIPAFQSWTTYLLAWLESHPADMHAASSTFNMLKISDDPEAVFLQGWLFCDAGEYEAGIVHLRRAVDTGYCAAPALARSRQFDAIRGDAVFQAIVADAEAGRRRARAAFHEAGGERLLGRAA